MTIDWQGAGDVELLFGELIDQEVNKHVLHRDRHAEALPNELFAKFAAKGIFEYALPETYGGTAAGSVRWGERLEKIGYLSNDLAFPFLLSVRMSFILLLLATGRREQVAPYIDALVRGQSFGAFAYTEDADAFSFKSRARYDARTDTYVLNGSKPFVTGGLTADLFTVFVASEDQDLQMFLLKRSDPGLSTTPMLLDGVRSLGTALLTLDNVVVGEERLLVRTDGLDAAQRHFLNARRSMLLCPFLGRARALIETTINYLQSTTRYAMPLAEMQHLQALVGEMYIALERSRAMVFRSLQRQYDGHADPCWDVISSAAKYDAVETVNAIATTALKLTGGWGFTEDSGLGRAHRDFMSLFAAGDSQEKLKVDLGARMIHELSLLQQRQTYQEGK